MPIKPAQWIVENRVIYAHAWGTSTVEDLLEHNTRMVILLEAGTAPVHALLHTEMERPPSMRLDVARSISGALGHPAMGYAILIGPRNPIMEFISRTLARFFGVKYEVFRTIEEAINFLKAEDPSINWDQLDESAISEHSGP